MGGAYTTHVNMTSIHKSVVGKRCGYKQLRNVDLDGKVILRRTKERKESENFNSANLCRQRAFYCRRNEALSSLKDSRVLLHSLGYTNLVKRDCVNGVNDFHLPYGPFQKFGIFLRN